MISYVLLLAALALAAVITALSLPEQGRTRLARMLYLSGLALLAFCGAFFLITGRLALGLGILALVALIFILIRGLAARHSPALPGNLSRIRTRWLDLILDRQTDELAGRVLRGDFTGRDLTDMKLSELLALRDACIADDGRSALLLETYLDRTYADWRQTVDL